MLCLKTSKLSGLLRVWVLSPDTIGEIKICFDSNEETVSVVCVNNRSFVVSLELNLFLKTLDSQEIQLNLTT